MALSVVGDSVKKTRMEVLGFIKMLDDSFEPPKKPFQDIKLAALKECDVSRSLLRAMGEEFPTPTVNVVTIPALPRAYVAGGATKKTKTELVHFIDRIDDCFSAPKMSFDELKRSVLSECEKSEGLLADWRKNFPKYSNYTEDVVYCEKELKLGVAPTEPADDIARQWLDETHDTANATKSSGCFSALFGCTMRRLFKSRGLCRARSRNEGQLQRNSSDIKSRYENLSSTMGKRKSPNGRSAVSRTSSFKLFGRILHIGSRNATSSSSSDLLSL